MIGLQIDGHSVTTISDTLPSQISGNANLSLYFQRPFLLPGNATVTVNFAEPRLDVSYKSQPTHISLIIPTQRS
jgi:hypothetical protein